jgi:chorismate synthase
MLLLLFAVTQIGSGFKGVLLTGREHNDEFYVDADGRTR